MIWLPLLQRSWWAIPALGLVLATVYYRTEYHLSEAHFGAYRTQIEAVAAQAQLAAKLKEETNAKTIVDAVADRNDAISRLQLAEAANRSKRVPLTPAPAQGSASLCFDPPALSSAVEQYRGRVRGLVTQGDEAQIDSQTLIKSWPKP